jgi:hypothetical protein
VTVVDNFSNSTKLELVEHPLRNSTELVNLVSIFTILVNPDLMDMECLKKILVEWRFGESRASESLPNRPYEEYRFVLARPRLELQ